MTKKLENYSDLPHVIIVGNPVDGLETYGPFRNAVEACEFGNTDADLPDEWWIMPVHPVERDEITRLRTALTELVDWTKDSLANNPDNPFGTVWNRAKDTLSSSMKNDQALKHE